MHRRPGCKWSVFKGHFQLPSVEYVAYIHFGSNRDIRYLREPKSNQLEVRLRTWAVLKWEAALGLRGETLVSLANLHGYRWRFRALVPRLATQHLSAWNTIQQIVGNDTVSPPLPVNSWIHPKRLPSLDIKRQLWNGPSGYLKNNQFTTL